MTDVDVVVELLVDEEVDAREEPVDELGCVVGLPLAAAGGAWVEFGAAVDEADAECDTDVAVVVDVLDAVDDVDVEDELTEGAFDSGWASRAETVEVLDAATVGGPAGASSVSLLAAIDVPTIPVTPRTVPAMTHPNARRRRRS